MSSRSVLASFFLASSMLFAACAPAAHQAAVPKIAEQKPSIDRAKLRDALAVRRKQVLDRFVAYREARVYPINSYTPGFQHVWFDAQGNFCAAANLIALDWGRDASIRIAVENNFIRLADVHSGPIEDWMLTTGLTHHEIVAIQGPDFAGGGRDIDPGQPIEPGPPIVVAPPAPPPPPELDPRTVEVTRLYNLWTDVQRQLDQMWDESLDDATTALMAHPDLARRLLDGQIADAGKYGDPDPDTVAFAAPPPVR